MNKKVIVIIIFIILILVLAGIWKSSNNQEDVETNDISEESLNETEENEEENQEDDDTSQEETTTNLGNSSSSNQASSSQTSSSQTSSSQEINESNSVKTIVSEVSPIGFMGSSLYKVVLYSDGEVYVRRYDGAGTEDENIVAEDIIAKNATSIEVVEDEEDEKYGEIIVKGGEAVDTDFGWIEFE